MSRIANPAGLTPEIHVDLVIPGLDVREPQSNDLAIQAERLSGCVCGGN